MIYIKNINSKNSKSCYEFDLNSIKLWNLNQWKNELEKENVSGKGIYTHNLILGLCVLHKIYDEAEIRYLSVHPSHKRKGLGKKLFELILTECKNENIKRIYLEVSQKNKQAISFYDNFGFTTICIRKKYYKDGSDALLKLKKLFNK